MPKKKINRTNIYKTITAILSLILGYLGFNQIKLQSIKPAFEYQVLSILDGDTFVINQSQRLRLLGIEAPEEEYCLGKESKAYLESLVKDQKVTLEEVGADKYGRVIALAYIGNTLINEAVIQEGMAEYDGHKNSRADLLKQAEAEAKLNKVGIFSTKCTQPENFEDSNCSIKGNKRDNKKLYSFQGCSNYQRTIMELYKGDQWFCSEAKAKKAGFKKSGNCYGKSFKIGK